MYIQDEDQYPVQLYIHQTNKPDQNPLLYNIDISKPKLIVELHVRIWDRVDP